MTVACRVKEKETRVFSSGGMRNAFELKETKYFKEL